MIYETSSCGRFGHPEFEIDVDETVPKPDVEWLLRQIESRVENGESFSEDELLQIGWSLTKVTKGNGDKLTLMEPDFLSFPISWKEGVTGSLMQYRLQNDTCESLGRRAVFPSIRESLIVATDLKDTLTDFLLERTASDDDSGWFIGNPDTSLDYQDPKNIRRVSLYQIAVEYRKLVQFLAIPAHIRIEYSRTVLRCSSTDGEVKIGPDSFLEQFLNRHGIRFV